VILRISRHNIQLNGEIIISLSLIQVFLGGQTIPKNSIYFQEGKIRSDFSTITVTTGDYSGRFGVNPTPEIRVQLKIVQECNTVIPLK
jgi:hypothetical protein